MCPAPFCSCLLHYNLCRNEESIIASYNLAFKIHQEFFTKLSENILTYEHVIYTIRNVCLQRLCEYLLQ